MSNRDGRGPEEKSGSGEGRGQRLGRGGGCGWNNGGRFGAGGYCICAKCGEKVPHQRSKSCTSVKCPKCGYAMVREELLTQK